MPLLNTILATTAFNTPLYSTLVPTIALAYTLQTLAAIPSIIFRTTRLFHLSGSFTHIACTLLSLFLPYLRARALGAFQGGLKDYLTSPAPGQRWWFWRQAVLSAAVVTWGFRSLLTRNRQPPIIDVRLDAIRAIPSKFYLAFLLQATWVSLSLLPVMAVNSLPRSTFAMQRIQSVPYRLRIPSEPYATDILGLTMFVVGFCFEGLADRQWVRKRKAGSRRSLTGLWPPSGSYFGELLLWSGLAATAGGLLVRNPALAGLGLSGVRGSLAVTALCAASPVFTAFLLSEA